MSRTEVKVPFNVPYLTGNEISYMEEALQQRHLSGDGFFTKKCQVWLEQQLECKKVLIVQSCTAALEMAGILIDLQPGDEIIVPSYTFVTSANAFVLKGAVPVFVDIRPDNLNIDENKIAAAITNKTKAIVVVHYGGVACNMDPIMDIAKQHNLFVIEDAAQALMSTYKGKMLGTIGHFGTFSFHATKNIICGEGGAICINDERFLQRSDIVREKGTNRKQYLNGQIDKYTWVDLGSSFLIAETTAAFLYAQLEQAAEITNIRLKIWHNYHKAFMNLNPKYAVKPVIPEDGLQNAHLYYLIFPNADIRTKVRIYCKEKNIDLVTHFVPLHESAAGKKYGRTNDALPFTMELSERILRLPLWPGIEPYQNAVITTVLEAIELFCENKVAV